MHKIPQFIKQNITNVKKCLEINIGERRGITDYIDFLKKDDFINYNVIYGEDSAKRFFISVLYNNTNTVTDENIKNQDHNIMTIFQRYTNEPYFFVSCGNTFIHNHDVQTYKFNNIDNKPMPTQFEHFFNLINNGQVTVTYNVNKLYNLDDEYFNIEKTLYYELYTANTSTELEPVIGL
jgi:hypothetical protein